MISDCIVKPMLKVDFLKPMSHIHFEGMTITPKTEFMILNPLCTVVCAETFLKLSPSAIKFGNH